MMPLDAAQAQRCRDLIVLAAHYQDTRDLNAFSACFAADGVCIRLDGALYEPHPDQFEPGYGDIAGHCLYGNALARAQIHARTQPAPP